MLYGRSIDRSVASSSISCMHCKDRSFDAMDDTSFEFTSAGTDAETSSSCSTAPTTMQPGFSFAVALEAFHSKLALELRSKCTQISMVPVSGAGGYSEFNCEEVGPTTGPNEGAGRFLALQKQLNEVQDEVHQWRASIGEMLERYERRKGDELGKLRELAASQVRITRQQAEEKVEVLTNLHAIEVQELYELFKQMQPERPLSEELLSSITTRSNRQLLELVDSQQQQIQQLQASNFLSHLTEQTLAEDAARLKLALHEKEDLLTSLTTEFEGLIPKLHGYIDAREHLLTTTLQETHRDSFQQLELSLRNEQRENAWMKRALQENKRKRADRLSRLQQQVLDLTQAMAERDDLIALLQRGSVAGLQSDHAFVPRFVPPQYHWQMQQPC